MAQSNSAFSLATRGLKLDTAESIIPHISPLTDPSAASTITSIDFSGNTLGVPACQHLATILPKLTSLHHANLADIFTGRLLAEIPQALDALLESLLPLKNLRIVNLSDNAFGLNTQAPLVQFLKRATALRHLILNNNGLGPEAGTLIANALTQLAEAKKSSVEAEERTPLETIVCGRNRLESGSMAAWARAVAAHGEGLREVEMKQNGIRQEGIELLLRSGFYHCTKLKALDLQDNTFTRTGARALAAVVKMWPELSELGVGDSLFSSRGMVALSEALAKGSNSKLEVLRLQFNEIDAKGIQALVSACEKGGLPELRRVEINGNTLDEDDPVIEKLRAILDERRKKASAEDDDDDAWGLDELDELEEPSDDEDEDSDGDDDDDEDVKVEVEAKADRELKQADETEASNVPQEKDKAVDNLADILGKTGI